MRARAGACLALATLGGVAAVAHADDAGPWRLQADLDGDGAIDHVELDAAGALRIETAAGATTLSVAPSIADVELQGAPVRGAPTVVIQGTTPAGREAIVVQRKAGAWKQLVRVPIGAVGLDADYAFAVIATPIGILRYQTRPGYARCDGRPALLFAEGFDGTRFRPLSKLPAEVPDNAPVLAARRDPDPASPPAVYQARVASHEVGATDAGALSIPRELDDGSADTFWREELAGSTGEGQFFTFQPRFAGARATELRIVPGNPSTAQTARTFARPHRLAIVSAEGTWRVDLPDAAGDALGAAYVVDLPHPVAGCVSVVLESTYGPPHGTAAIAELEVYGDRERGGGGDEQLAQVVASGADGSVSAEQALAHRGAPAVVAIEGELGKTSDGAARARLLRALVASRDPSAGPVLARAAASGWVSGSDLIDVIGALRGLGQAQALHDLAAAHAVPLDARLAAVAALSPEVEKDRAALVELAGRGPRELRREVIDTLAKVDAVTLAQAAQAAVPAPAAGDLWRAATRRAHTTAGERSATVAAMTEALRGATDYERRYRLFEGLATLGDGPAIDALGHALAAVPDGADRAAFAQVTARALASNPRPEALGLAMTLARDPDPGVRAAAIGALDAADAGTVGPWHAPDGPDATDRVIASALSTDLWPDVRRRAAQALGTRCMRPGPARALVDAVARDPELEVRGDALGALVQCKAAGAAALLARVWGDDQAPLVLRQRAVDLTVSLGDPALAARLVDQLRAWRGAALASSDALALAQNAAYAIGRLAPPGAAAALEDALGDVSFPEIVGAAAAGLGLLGPACPASARGKLRALSASDDQQVRIPARHAAAQCGVSRRP